LKTKTNFNTTNRLAFERNLWSHGIKLVAGVDEAGRGPLAGPVVAAAVVLPATWANGGFEAKLSDLNDSKQLTEAQREHFFQILTSHPEIRHAIAIVDAATIDRINILQATHRAMNEALAKLQPQPQHVLVDGRPVKSMTLPQTALVKGDSRSYSIAAASVLAKVTRDRMMLEFDAKFPGLRFCHPQRLRRAATSCRHRRARPVSDSPDDVCAAETKAGGTALKSSGEYLSEE
jgi:ribonuclease HII